MVVRYFIVRFAGVPQKDMELEPEKEHKISMELLEWILATYIYPDGRHGGRSNNLMFSSLFRRGFAPKSTSRPGPMS